MLVRRRLHAIDLGEQQVQVLSDSALQLAVGGHSQPIPEQAFVKLVESRPALQVVERVVRMSPAASGADEIQWTF